MKSKLLPIVALFTSFNLSAWEIDLGSAAEYNIFVQNDFTHTGTSDSQGKIAVGGNASVDQYDVGINYNPNTNLPGVQFWERESGYSDVLVVQGNLSVNRADNIKGNLVLGGELIKNGTTVNAPNSLVPGNDPVLGEVFNFTDRPLDFDSAFSYLTQLSSDLAQLTNTGEIVAKGNQWWQSTQEFIFTPNNTLMNEQGVLVMDFDGANLQEVTSFTATGLDANMPIIINISGTDISFDSIDYFGDLAQEYAGDLSYVGGKKKMPNNILFNFYEAEHLAMTSGGFYGNILAPTADFEFLSGDLSGQVIAKSWTSNSGAQANLWNGLYPSAEGERANVEIAEPTSIALFLLAILAMLSFQRRSYTALTLSNPLAAVQCR
ncbi:choice-of-anchor A family protein [Catenovulum sediminis]|uniref:choice-of-anchor A family protein n=1 Tax=Catenovulum sediminis TaxID=1740262 RepID=UPI00118028B2|nr:choice-of-anchor A family protein [Catenovulum sediminis]